MDWVILVAVLGAALAILIYLVKMEQRLMGELEDLDIVLGEINATTTEIGEDLLDAISKIGSAPTPDQWAAFKNKLMATSAQLKGIASSYPPVPPAESGSQG